MYGIPFSPPLNYNIWCLETRQALLVVPPAHWQTEAPLGPWNQSTCIRLTFQLPIDQSIMIGEFSSPGRLKPFPGPIGVTVDHPAPLWHSWRQEPPVIAFKATVGPLCPQSPLAVSEASFYLLTMVSHLLALPANPGTRQPCVFRGSEALGLCPSCDYSLDCVCLLMQEF